MRCVTKSKAQLIWSSSSYFHFGLCATNIKDVSMLAWPVKSRLMILHTLWVGHALLQPGFELSYFLRFLFTSAAGPRRSGSSWAEKFRPDLPSWRRPGTSITTRKSGRTRGSSTRKDSPRKTGSTTSVTFCYWDQFLLDIWSSIGSGVTCREDHFGTQDAAEMGSDIYFLLYLLEVLDEWLKWRKVFIDGAGVG